MINDFPPVIIFEEDRKALEEFDTEEELDTLTNFLIEQLEKTWQR